jgi:toxin ParE1/3/4
VKLEFHPEAERELLEAATYYEARVPGLGAAIAEEVDRATGLLLEHPGLGSPADPSHHRFALHRFPFTIYYTVSSGALRVEAIAHECRLPGYWKSRRPPDGD